MWELDSINSINRAEHQRIDAFELWCWRRLESPLNCKEIQPVHPKRNQSWIFIGRTDVEAEAPILWPPDAKNWLIWKDRDAGKDWRQEEKGMSKLWEFWWIGRPGVLHSVRSQRVRHDWATELIVSFDFPGGSDSKGSVLGREYLLEKGMATNSSILAWRILFTEKPGGLKSMGSQSVRYGWGTNTSRALSV